MPTRRMPLRLKFNWMKFLRRVHLYSGVFLLPWVLLYGVSAFLFNHPFSFSGNDVVTIDSSRFTDTPLSVPADAQQDALMVVEALNNQLNSRPDTTGSLTIDPSVAPRYLKDTLSLRARGSGTSHIVAYEIGRNRATVEVSEVDLNVRAPFETRGLKVKNSLSERIRASLPLALKQAGIEVDEIGMATGSTLRFQVLDSEGKAWLANYQIQTGTVTGQPANVKPNFSLRQFILGLHRTHAYPSKPSWTWLWAVWVDAMAIAMILWAASGLLMWWQLKKLRWNGALVLASGILLFGVSVGMLLFETN